MLRLKKYIKALVLVAMLGLPSLCWAAFSDPFNRESFSKRKYDLIGVGAGSVDVIAFIDEDEFRRKLVVPYNIEKGSTTDIDMYTADELENIMKNAKIIPGGDATNVIANFASLGGYVALSTIVDDDNLGKFYNHNLNLLGIINMCLIKNSEQKTDRNLVFVTPDAERTILSYRGVSNTLNQTDIKYHELKDYKAVYIEGAIWDGGNDASKAVMRLLNVAEKVEVKKILSLGDVYLVGKYRDDFLKLLPRIDMIFCNEKEALALFDSQDLNEVIVSYQKNVPITVITRGEKGALIITKDKILEIEPPSLPKDKIIDTSGAGFGFAAGFLYGYTHGLVLEKCAELARESAAGTLQRLGGWPRSVDSRDDL